VKHLIAVALFVCVSWVMPPPASAQSLADEVQRGIVLQHQLDCVQIAASGTTAWGNKQWELMVSIFRRYFTDCRDVINKDQEVRALNSLGIGLAEQGKLDDAIPILERCVALEPDSTPCFLWLGKIFAALDKTEDARKAFNHVISIGGYDQVSAGMVEAARKFLAELPPIAKPSQETNPETPTENQKFGTGFFVSAEGHILTNNHVVDGCKSLATTGGAILSVVSRNEAADLALLKSNIKPPSVAVFGSSLHVGDAVMAFGFPLPGLLTPEGNSTNGIISALSGPKGDLNLIQITAPVQPGNSGGPLVDQYARVVGVIVAKLDALEVAKVTGDIPQNVNFAIKNNLVTAFLDSTEIQYRTSSSTAAMDWPAVARTEKSMSVAIVCAE
jgi:S1-C subfamily serine protease